MELDSVRFEDRGEIARGGIGAVRKMFDRTIKREVAVKSLVAQGREEDRLDFSREAQVLGQLDHPNIVPLYDVTSDVEGVIHSFAMKLVSGRTLASLIHDDAESCSSHHRLERLLQIFVKICDAIAFAHSRGIIHRDLKPENVMVGEYGEVYVMDWGFALVLGLQRGGSGAASTGAADSTRDGGDGWVSDAPTPPEVSGRLDATGTLTGTICYMAPEQATGRVRDIDARTDVFGLGGILYEFLTGFAPYSGTAVSEVLVQARAGHVAPPAERARDAVPPPGLCRIAMKALSLSPTDRYQSVVDLKRDVESFVRGGGWFSLHHFPRGTVIIRENETGDCAYIVEEGRCEVSRTVDGRKVLLRTIGPGEVFGEVGLFTASPRVATVEAATDVKVLLVTPDSLERELGDSTWLRAFVKTTAERFVEADCLTTTPRRSVV